MPNRIPPIFENETIPLRLMSQIAPGIVNGIELMAKRALSRDSAGNRRGVTALLPAGPIIRHQTHNIKARRTVLTKRVSWGEDWPEEVERTRRGNSTLHMFTTIFADFIGTMAKGVTAAKIAASKFILRSRSKR
jgi:hypothetical protein